MENHLEKQDIFSVLQLKFPNGVSDVIKLSEEQKAWLQIAFQSITKIKNVQTILKLHKMHKRLIHAEEDISDRELQEMASYIFNNIDEIRKCTNKQDF